MQMRDYIAARRREIPLVARSAPGGMTIKRDDTQVVPYVNCWLTVRSVGLYATPRWGAVARDSSGRLAAPGGMTFKRDDTGSVPTRIGWSQGAAAQ